MKITLFRISLALNIIFILASVFLLFRYKDSLLAKFIKPSQEKVNIAMYGDSRVQVADWSTGLNRKDVLNAGISGFTTPQLFDSLNSRVLKFHPKICFIEAGINDIRNRVNMDSTLSAFTKIIDTLVANKIRVVINSVIPVSKDPFQYAVPDSVINAKVEELNSRLHLICKRKGVEYLDINQELAEGKRFKLKYTLDGVHVHSEGFKVWFAYVTKSLDKYKL